MDLWALHGRSTWQPCEFIGFGAMDATKPCEFIGFGAMDATKPYEFMKFVAMDATNPYEFIRFGAMDPLSTSPGPVYLATFRSGPGDLPGRQAPPAGAPSSSSCPMPHPDVVAAVWQL